ncbi:MAG: HAD family hydrolase [Clostridiales bacterium]|nr:HAD family hydrolase [Clostridiales bacterium]
MYKYLLFDLDGTLIDSFPSIIEAYQLALEGKYGKREKDVKKLERLIGLPLKEFFIDYPIEDREELQQSFAKNNDALQYNGVPFFEGVKEVLLKAIDRGAKLGIVTSKRRAPVLHWLDVSGCKDMFCPVVAREDTKLNKPFGEPIEKAVELIGADKREVLYVGDTVHDIACAKNAGVDVAVVSWTATDMDVIANENPEIIISKPQDLLDLI